MSQHFRGCQNADGGWGYTAGARFHAEHGHRRTGQHVPGLRHVPRQDLLQPAPIRARSPTGEAAEVLQVARTRHDLAGQGHRATRTTATTCTASSGRAWPAAARLIGGEDWFARGALAVLRAQAAATARSRWASWGGPAVSTAFCTLFLVYGGAPVAFNKLQYGDGPGLEPESARPGQPDQVAVVGLRAAAELADRLDRRAGRRDRGAASCSSAARRPRKFSEEQMLKLREYVQGGGTILAEPSDHSRGVRRVDGGTGAADVPGAGLSRATQLQPLPADHGSTR